MYFFLVRKIIKHRLYEPNGPQRRMVLKVHSTKFIKPLKSDSMERCIRHTVKSKKQNSKQHISYNLF